MILTIMTIESWIVLVQQQQHSLSVSTQHHAAQVYGSEQASWNQLLLSCCGTLCSSQQPFNCTMVVLHAA